MTRPEMLLKEKRAQLVSQSICKEGGTREIDTLIMRKDVICLH